MTRGKKKSTAPAKPAPVSGPGALSRRTDSANDPITVTDVREMPASGAEPFGAKTENIAAQQAIDAGGGAGAAAAPGVTPEMVQAAIDGLIDGPGKAIFADTQRPDEPLTAGAAPIGLPPTPILPDDPDAPLRGLLAVFPHPDISALIAVRRPARGGL